MENENQFKVKKPNPDDEVHTVDGIVELNHPAPFWWQTIYYISIVWAIGYGWYYLAGGGPTLKQELQAKLEAISSRVVVAQISPEQEKKDLRDSFKDTNRLAAGLAVYNKNCVSCHAADGGGGIGPNLTDRHWINGDGGIDMILKLARVGVPDKGMPPWGPILKHDELINVSAFIRTMRDKSPAKPKAPQGNAVVYTQDI